VEVRGPRGLRAKLALLLVATVAVTALAAAAAAAWRPEPGTVFGVGLGVGALAALAALGRGFSSVTRTLDALADGVRSFKDQDFSLRLSVARDDELGQLVGLYNEIGDRLRAERHDLYQRELLLDTVLQGAPLAIFLAGPTGRVAYANRAARDLLSGGRRLEGRAVDEVLAQAAPEMKESLAGAGDSLFSLGPPGEEETYRTARRTFHLNTQPHTLYLAERLTPELRRREVEVWKKAIRVMNHELNNSLAPIRSLAHSARRVAGRPEHAHRLDDIFATIEERATHLADFLEGYARFARLPRPRRQAVPWDEFLAGVHRLTPFRLEGAPPAEPGWFDPAQLQQVLINLLKNAHEAGSPEGEVVVAVRRGTAGTVAVEVSDRGRGMDQETLGRALLPFYSSKPSGAGLGLPLCKEILEAHGGGLRVQGRPGGGMAVTCWLPPGEGMVEVRSSHAP
jgi:nitrogen fixation/metabolism regulation signal transduction histidine kinase